MFGIDVEASLMEWPAGSEPELCLSIATTEVFQATIVYNRQLFEPGSIERLADHYQQLLFSAAERPDEPLSRFPLLCARERRQVLLEWNSTTQEYDNQSCVHELFEHVAERWPAAVAAVDGNQKITYGDLDARANMLAARLRRLGVGPDTLVGLYLSSGCIRNDHSTCRSVCWAY